MSKVIGLENYKTDKDIKNLIEENRKLMEMEQKEKELRQKRVFQNNKKSEITEREQRLIDAEERAQQTFLDKKILNNYIEMRLKNKSNNGIPSEYLYAIVLLESKRFTKKEILTMSVYDIEYEID